MTQATPAAEITDAVADDAVTNVEAAVTVDAVGSLDDKTAAEIAEAVSPTVVDPEPTDDADQLDEQLDEILEALYGGDTTDSDADEDPTADDSDDDAGDAPLVGEIEQPRMVDLDKAHVFVSRAGQLMLMAPYSDGSGWRVGAVAVYHAHSMTNEQGAEIVEQLEASIEAARAGDAVPAEAEGGSGGNASADSGEGGNASADGS